MQVYLTDTKYTYSRLKPRHRDIVCQCPVYTEIHHGLAELRYGGFGASALACRSALPWLNPLHEVTKGAEAVRLRQPEDQRFLQGQRTISKLTQSPGALLTCARERELTREEGVFSILDLVSL